MCKLIFGYIYFDDVFVYLTEVALFCLWIWAGPSKNTSFKCRDVGCSIWLSVLHFCILYASHILFIFSVIKIFFFEHAITLSYHGETSLFLLFGYNVFPMEKTWCFGLLHLIFQVPPAIRFVLDRVIPPYLLAKGLILHVSLQNILGDAKIYLFVRIFSL